MAQPGIHGTTSEGPGAELRALVAVDDGLATRTALVDGHAKRVGRVGLRLRGSDLQQTVTY